MVSQENTRETFKLHKNRTLIFVYVLAIIIGYITYLTQYFWGERIAEGSTIFFASIALLMSCFLVRQRSAGVLFNLFLFYTLFIFGLTLTYVAFGGGYGRFFFIYQYIYILSFFYIYNIKIRSSHLYNAINVEFLLKVIVVIGAVSSAFAIMQALSTHVWPPIDINRARGLSRSTLNYSGLCLIAFQATLISKFNKILKTVFLIIIFLGALSAFGRGVMLGCLASFIVSYILLRESRFPMNILICMVIFLIARQIVSHNADTVLKYTERYSSSFNTQTDAGNIQRIGSMKNFLGEISLFGGGFGSTGPAAGRFNKVTGFESSILNFLYQGGLLTVLFLPFLFLVFVFDLVRKKRLNLLLIIIPQLIVLAVQQVHENPSVNSLFWIFLSLVSLRR